MTFESINGRPMEVAGRKSIDLAGAGQSCQLAGPSSGSIRRFRFLH